MMWMIPFGFGASCSRPAAAAADVPAPTGAAADAPATQPAEGEEREQAKAVFAGGCFWCVEAVFEQLDGVGDVVSGYAGGSAETATYDKTSAGGTGHAEVVEVTYDPSVITYGELMHVFMSTHHPTQVNGQGPDHGSQYRSAIFYADEGQRAQAEAYIVQLNESGVFDKPIATTLEPLDRFYPAEQYHQDFVVNNPDHGYVRQWALPKIEKVRTKFADDIKTDGDAAATQPAS